MTILSRLDPERSTEPYRKEEQNTPPSILPNLAPEDGDDLPF